MDQMELDRDQSRFNWLSIICFIAGFTLPFLLSIIGELLDKQPKIEPYVGYLGLSCEFLAIVFGLLSWRQRSSKAIVTVVMVAGIALIGLLTMKGASSSPPRAQEPLPTPVVSEAKNK